QRLNSVRSAVEHRLTGFTEDTSSRLDSLSKSLSEAFFQLQGLVTQDLTQFPSSLEQGIDGIHGIQKQQTQSMVSSVDGFRSKLEEMRRTVDEKLQGTLEARLGESFKLVSERLEQVHRGLGEMQTLAAGVGDLKKVLTNVKTRGTWGEVQLGNLLEQLLTPEQYAENVDTTGTGREAVEVVLKLTGRDEL